MPNAALSEARSAALESSDPANAMKPAPNKTRRGWRALGKMSRNNRLESDFESNDQADIRELVELRASLVSGVFIGHR